MVTTIQVNERTLQLLKKIKDETESASYDEAIVEVIIERSKKESRAGSLAGFLGKKDRKKIIKELQDERKKGDRF